MLTVLKHADRLIARIEYGAMIVLMAALILILTAQVVLRYFFASPIFWAEDVAVQILTAATCIGVSYLIYRNDMVKVDFLLSILPESVVKLMKRGIYLIGFAAMMMVGIYAAEWLMRPENMMLVSPTTGLLKWYNYLIMVICFYLTAFHLLVKLCLPPEFGKDYVEEDGIC